MKRKSLPLLIGLLLLNLILGGCTDQPPPRPPAPTKTVVPPPSTPGPTPQTSPEASSTNEAGSPVAGPELPTPTPVPTPGRALVGVPLLSGSLPDFASLPVPLTDPTTARQIAQFAVQSKTDTGKPEPLRALALSPDRKWLALADRYQIWVIELPSGKLLQNLATSNPNSDDWGAHSLAWSPDGLMLAAGGLSGVTTLWRWDSTTSNFRKGPLRLSATALTETFGDAVEVAFSPDNKQLAAFGSDGNINIFSTNNGQLQATFVSDFAGYVSWSPDSTRLTDEFLLLHYLDGGRTLPPDDTIAVASDGPQGVAWSSDGKTIAVSGNGFALLLVEVPTPNPPDQANPAISQTIVRVKLPGGPGQPTSLPSLKEGRRVVWSPGSRWVAIANVPTAGKISLWDSAGRPVLTLDGGSEAIRALAWPVEGLLVSAGNDGTARFWQLEAPAPTPTPGPLPTPSPTP